VARACGRPSSFQTDRSLLVWRAHALAVQWLMLMANWAASGAQRLASLQVHPLACLFVCLCARLQRWECTRMRAGATLPVDKEQAVLKRRRVHCLACLHACVCVCVSVNFTSLLWLLLKTNASSFRLSVVWSHIGRASACQTKAATSYPGGDLADMNGTSVASCCAACSANPKCAGFTYRTAVESGAPDCFLKRTMAHASDCSTCTSGVRAGGSVN
jgi:hypothetical protein